MSDKSSKVKKSIEKMSSPEQLDQLLYLVQPRLLYPILVVLGLLVIAIIWAFFGRIPTEVSGRGVTLTPEGVFSVVSQTDGTVTDILINEGDFVKKGGNIVKIFSPQYSSILSKIEAVKFKISQLEAEIEMLEARLESRKKLHSEGLVAKTVVEDTQSQLYAKLILLEESKSSLDTFLSELLDASASANRELIKTLYKAEISGEQAQFWEEELSKVHVPYSGKVLEILVKKGDIITEKQPLVWMEYPHTGDSRTLFQSYISVKDGNKVREGMRVRIEPTIVNPQEFGSINGVVKSVSAYAISEDELLNSLRNKQLVGYLIEGSSAVVQVEVEPVQDPDSPSGFSWTSGKGPDFKIPTGTVVDIHIVVEEQPPISFLIPLWKLKPQY